MEQATHVPTALYQKPAYICQRPDAVFPGLPLEEDAFFQGLQRYVEQELAQQGLKVRLATTQDIPAVEEFTRHIYQGEQATEISPYDLYRFLSFGHGVVLHDLEDRLRGCLFGVRYATPEQPSYTVRLAVDPNWNGRKIGYHLIIRSCLQARQSGALIKSGIIDFDNHTNLYINLNHIGWIARDFDGYITAVGSCFDVCLPLTVGGMTRNAIDLKKVQQFLKEADPKLDYRALPAHDLEGMHHLFRETDFKVVAFLPQGQPYDTPHFLALPSAELNYQALQA